MTEPNELRANGGLAPARSGPAGWLFRPFVWVAGGRALGLGLVAIVMAAALGYLGHTHFDGVVDVHSGRPAPGWVFLVEGLVDWLILSVVLYALGRLLARPFRAVDLFGTQALTRVAAEAPAAAGLIMLAAATRPLEDLMLAQMRYPAGLEGGISAQEQAQLEAVERAAATGDTTAQGR